MADSQVSVFTEIELLSDIQGFFATWDSPASVLVTPRSLANDPSTKKPIKLFNAEYPISHFGLFTSGSTGKPQLLIGNKERAHQLVEKIHFAQDNQVCDSTVLILPPTYSYAFVNQLIWAHHFKKQIVLTSGFKDPECLFKSLEETASSMTCMVKSLVPMLFRYAGKRTFPNVLRLNFAGGPFPHSHFAELKNIFPNAKVFNNYGCTEALPRLTVQEMSIESPIGEVGKPLIGIEMTTNSDGEILFKSPYSAVARITENGIQRLTDEWIPTGDFGDCQNGKWQVKGRNNEVFKRHGEKIVVQSVISRLEEVWGHALYWYPSPDSLGEPSFSLVIEGTVSKDSIKTLLLELRATFSRYQWPLKIESVEKVPFLENNKVDSLQLAKDKNIKRTVLWSQNI
ncbi:MAG: acyl--CoA ligase [Bdellovibrionales bacterium]|nr:acyl--CoA ligase [Bdellovibrionales bacterium]